MIGMSVLAWRSSSYRPSLRWLLLDQSEDSDFMHVKIPDTSATGEIALS
jgi:hypothetical protein